MPFLIAGTAAVTTAIGLRSNSKARKAARRAADNEARAIGVETSRTEANLFEQARAADMARDNIADRLLLQRKQQDEADRQAGQSGVEFELGESAAEREEGTKRRRTFFDYGSGA